MEARRVAVEIVVTDADAPRDPVRIPDVAHPQRGAEGRVPGVLANGLELRRPGRQERARQRRRCSEEVEQQPPVPKQVADQPEIVRVGERAAGSVPHPILTVGGTGLGQHRPEPGGKRIVEVDARDHLHHSPVAMAEPDAVHVPEHSGIGASVAGDGDRLVARDLAGHARRPEQLVADVAGHEAMETAEIARDLGPVVERRRHELEQRLGVVRGEPRVGERGAEGKGVRGRRELPAGTRPQALLLHPLEAGPQHIARPREALDATVKRVVQRPGPYGSVRSARTRRAMRNDSTAAGIPQ